MKPHALAATCALLFSTGCLERQSSWREVDEPAPGFELEDLNPGSDTFGATRSLLDEHEVIVLYFANYG
jgi:hypothetical protein